MSEQSSVPAHGAAPNTLPRGLSLRLCTAADKQALVAFMDAHWGSKHPLVHCDDYFSYYYESEATLGAFPAQPIEHLASPIQFAVAEETGKMVALAGYLWSAQSNPRDIWVSIWCAIKGKNGVGLELMAALPSLTGARVMSCNNIRPKTMAFYTFLGYTAARLPHFYRLADKPLSDFVLARVHTEYKRISPVHSNVTLLLVREKEVLLRNFVSNPALRPHKDAWYAARRYFDFPRQHYDVYAVCEVPSLTAKAEKPSISALLITRTVPVNGTFVLRIVDYIGAPERFAALGNAIDTLMQTADAEYAECYCYGIASEVFAAAGFCERTETDANIIPNYLTPPLYENTEYYFFTSDPDHFTMFKADGDQDRPNIVL